jgi:hypothetical protein
MAAPTITTPDFTGVVDQQVFLRPLGGPDNPKTYLDSFPDTLYNKGVDSHLVKLLYTLLGPAGLGWLRKNYLEARLKLEDFGFETFDLDAFYGDPLRFGRILEEIYDEDPSGLLTAEQWEALRAKDAKYRNRAIDFVNGARAGGTPFGMHLVARSGLGHEVEVIENYRWIYDFMSDDYMGLDYWGKTVSTEEMIVIPRRETPQNEVQVLTISGEPTGGDFTLFFPVGDETANTTGAISHDATAAEVRAFLGAIASIGVDNVRVEGGPLPDTPLRILFTGALANRDVPQLRVTNNLTGPSVATILITTERSGQDQTEEVVEISPRDQRYLRDAVGRIKPMTTILTFNSGRGLRKQQTWNTVYAPQTYVEVLRYVRGQSGVNWPDASGTHWIEEATERQAKRSNDHAWHYGGFHSIASLRSHGEDLLTSLDYLEGTWTGDYNLHKSNHIGSFSRYQRTLFPFLDTQRHDQYEYEAGHAVASYAEPLTVTAATGANKTVPLVNGIYPADYEELTGTPDLRYNNELFWASLERGEGIDYLEIDLGSVQAVNYLYFEVSRKPVDIKVAYDVLDLSPLREWRSVAYEQDVSSAHSISFNPTHQNPWERAEIRVVNDVGQMLYARYLRLAFERRQDENSPFRESDGTLIPFSIEVRNLRVGRLVN